MLDIEKLMREGKSADEIASMVTKEMNAAQKKIDEETAAKAAKELKEEAIKGARKEAVTALTNYFALVFDAQDKLTELKGAVEQALDAIISLGDMYDNIKISYNGKPVSIFDIL